MSYSQPFLTFRATERTALRTGYGSESFVGFYERGSVPTGFIAEHRSEHRPASIRDRLCHSRLFELGSVHIADNDQFIFTRDLGGLLMQMVAPGVGYLGVDRLSAPLVSGSLRGRQRGFISPVIFERRNRGRITTRRESLKAKVYSDTTIAGWEAGIDPTLKCNVPSAASVLHERSGFNNIRRIPRLPKVEVLLPPFNVPVFNGHKPTLEWQPCQRATTADACPKSRTAALGIASNGKMPTYLANRFRANLKARSRAELHKVEMCRPANGAASGPIALCFALHLATIIPDEIDLAGVTLQSTARRVGTVLDSVFVCEKHQAGLRSVRAERWSRARLVLAHQAGSHFYSGFTRQFQPF